MDEATRSTVDALYIKPFQRRKDGRGACNAIITHYAVEDKWRAELKIQDELLHSRKWKVQSNYTLERFVAQHRNAFVSMTQCAEHVDYQFPNELTRVTYLLDAIENNDTPLQAAMALCRNDQDPGGKMNDFEATAAFLLPHDPVDTKIASGTKRSHAMVSFIDGNVASASTKVSTGSTGVAFRYYDTEEYNTLTNLQKEELIAYRIKLVGEGKKLKNPNGKKQFDRNSSNDRTSSSFKSKKVKIAVSQAFAK